MKTRILKFTLFVAILFVLLSVGTNYVYADDNDSVVKGEGVWVNSLYEDVIDEKEFLKKEQPETVTYDLRNGRKTELDKSDYLTMDKAAQIIRQGMVSREENLDVNYYVSEKDFVEISLNVDELLEKVFMHTGISNEGDYLNWHSKGFRYDYEVIRQDSKYWIKLSLLRISFDTTLEEEEEVASAVERVIKNLKLENKSDYDKAYKLYKYVCDNVVYDYDNTTENGDPESIEFGHAHSAYGAIINGKAVCEGYATLLYRLLLECGIDNRLISGGTLHGAHGWNIVKIDGNYFNADATWDAGAEEFQWFLKGSSYFRNDGSHREWAECSTPEFLEEYKVSPINYEDIKSAVNITGQGTCGKNVKWKLDNAGVLTISGQGEMNDFETAIDSDWNGFDGWIKKIVVEEGITSIGNYAFFSCTAIEGVVFPNTLEHIGEMAFAFCDSMEEIKFPNNVRTVGDSVFSNCYKLEKADLSNQLSSVGDKMFVQCQALKTINIPEGVENIGNSAFYDCCNLENVKFPNTLKRIGDWAYYHTMTYDKNDKIIIPNSVEYVGEYCFGWSGIDEIIWSEKAKAVGDGSFYHAYKLNNVELCEGLKSIGDQAFVNCIGIVSLELPESVSEIKPGAFAWCENLVEINLPEGITKIDEATFSGCYKIEHMDIPNTVEEIGYKAFENCGFRDIVLPANLKIIGDHAFNGCKNLTKIVIPDKVTTLGEYVFFCCDNLESVTFEGNAPRFAELTFYNRGMVVYYPENDITWTENVRKDYGGVITWEAYDPLECVGHENGTPDVITWKYDEKKHWYECTVCHKKAGNEKHAFKNDGNTDECEICGYKTKHAYSTEWRYDLNYHWQECEACEKLHKKDYHVYKYERDRDICKICGYETEHSCNMLYVYDEEKHWWQCEKCNKTEAIERHEFDGEYCMYCGYSDDSECIIHEFENNICSKCGHECVVIDFLEACYYEPYTGEIEVTDSDLYYYIQSDVADFTLKFYYYTDEKCKNPTYKGTDMQGDAPINPGIYYVIGEIIDSGEYKGYRTETPLEVIVTPSMVDFQVSNKASYISLEWNELPEAEGYLVRRRVLSDEYTEYKDYKIIDDPSVTSLKDKNIKQGKEYCYKMYAYTIDEDGTRVVSFYDEENKIVRATVKSVTNQNKSVKLTWTKIPNAVRYEIYRKASGSDKYSLIKKIQNGKTTSYTDDSEKTIRNGKASYYYVVAYRKKGNATVLKTNTKTNYYVTRPTVSSVSASSKAFTVKWKKNSKATGYQIRYSTSSSFNNYKTVTVKSADTLSKKITGLSKSKKYYVKVRAYKTYKDVKYYSAWSGYKSIKTK